MSAGIRDNNRGRTLARWHRGGSRGPSSARSCWRTAAWWWPTRGTWRRPGPRSCQRRQDSSRSGGEAIVLWEARSQRCRPAAPWQEDPPQLRYLLLHCQVSHSHWQSGQEPMLLRPAQSKILPSIIACNTPNPPVQGQSQPEELLPKATLGNMRASGSEARPVKRSLLSMLPQVLMSSWWLWLLGHSE